MIASLTSRVLTASASVAAGSLLLVCVGSHAAGAGEQSTMERPALQLRQPQRAAILATANAGRRLIAVGERGVALWSEDDGRSWHQAKVPVSATLTAVCFADARVGWAVGHRAVILQTVDGGSSWSRVYDGHLLANAANASLLQVATQPPKQGETDDPRSASLKLLAEPVADKPLLDVRFVDSKIGFAVGAYGLFLATRDGGQTWELATQKLENPKALHLNAIRIRGRSVLIAGEQGTAYLSTDGGETFRSLVTPYRGSYLSAALSPSGGLALAGLRGNLLLSLDSESTWATVKLPTSAGLTVLDYTGSDELRIGAQSGQIFAYRAKDNAVRELSRRGPPMLATLIEAGDGALVAGGLRGIDRMGPAGVAKP